MVVPVNPTLVAELPLKQELWAVVVELLVRYSDP
jgi:hypothetical protein